MAWDNGIKQARGREDKGLSTRRTEKDEKSGTGSGSRMMFGARKKRGVKGDPEGLRLLRRHLDWGSGHDHGYDQSSVHWGRVHG